MPDFELIVPKELVAQLKETEFMQSMIQSLKSKPIERMIAEYYPLVPLVKTLVKRECNQAEKITFKSDIVVNDSYVSCRFHTEIPGMKSFAIRIQPQKDGTVEITVTDMYKGFYDHKKGVEEVPRQRLLSEMRRILSVQNIRTEIANQIANQKSGRRLDPEAIIRSRKEFRTPIS